MTSDVADRERDRVRERRHRALRVLLRDAQARAAAARSGDGAREEARVHLVAVLPERPPGDGRDQPDDQGADARSAASPRLDRRDHPGARVQGGDRDEDVEPEVLEQLARGLRERARRGPGSGCAGVESTMPVTSRPTAEPRLSLSPNSGTGMRAEERAHREADREGDHVRRGARANDAAAERRLELADPQPAAGEAKDVALLAPPCPARRESPVPPRKSALRTKPWPTVRISSPTVFPIARAVRARPTTSTVSSPTAWSAGSGHLGAEEFSRPAPSRKSGPLNTTTSPRSSAKRVGGVEQLPVAAHPLDPDVGEVPAQLADGASRQLGVLHLERAHLERRTREAAAPSGVPGSAWVAPFSISRW